MLTMIKSLLDKYIDEENNLTNEYKYYCHTSKDPESEFDHLSNCNKLVVKTRLDPIHIPTIMLFFECIYKDEYSILEDASDWIQDKNLENDVSIEKIENYDIDEWWKYSQLNALKNIDKVERDYIYNELIYNEIPQINKDYDNRTKKKQKIYELKDIKKLIKN